MIEVQHVGKRFGKLVALDNITLTITPGEHVGFVGTNGSGKTTLLRTILGLVRTSGRVLVDGIDVAKSPETALVRVAYIPQIAPPLEAPVSEVIRAYTTLRAIAPDAVTAAAKTLGLAVDRSARFKDLSGGTKQKLLAAMALATNAPILVCDEPTANLDSEARSAFFAAVSARPKTSIVLLCSHREEEIRRMVDRVIEMKDGQVISDRAVRKPDHSRLRLVAS